MGSWPGLVASAEGYLHHFPHVMLVEAFLPPLSHTSLGTLGCWVV